MVRWEEDGEVAEVLVGDFAVGTVDEHHAGGRPIFERAGGDEFRGEFVVEIGGVHGWVMPWRNRRI